MSWHRGGDSSPLSWSKSSLRDRPAHSIGLGLSGPVEPRSSGVTYLQINLHLIKTLFFVCPTLLWTAWGDLAVSSAQMRWCRTHYISFFLSPAGVALCHVIRSSRRRRSEIVPPLRTAEITHFFSHLHQLLTCFVCCLLDLLLICSRKSLFPPGDVIKPQF